MPESNGLTREELIDKLHRTTDLLTLAHAYIDKLTAARIEMQMILRALENEKRPSKGSRGA